MWPTLKNVLFITCAWKTYVYISYMYMYVCVCILRPQVNSRSALCQIKIQLRLVNLLLLILKVPTEKEEVQIYSRKFIHKDERTRIQESKDKKPVCIFSYTLLVRSTNRSLVYLFYKRHACASFQTDSLSGVLLL